MRECIECGSQTDLNPLCIVCEESYSATNRRASEAMYLRHSLVRGFLKALDTIVPCPTIHQFHIEIRE